MMKYFLDTSIPTARTDSVRASWVPRSDPACLTCLRFLGRSSKRPSWPKINSVSTQAKIKSIYRGEEANKVPILEAVLCRKCNKWAGEAVLGMPANRDPSSSLLTSLTSHHLPDGPYGWERRCHKGLHQVTLARAHPSAQDNRQAASMHAQ